MSERPSVSAQAHRSKLSCPHKRRRPLYVCAGKRSRPMYNHPPSTLAGPVTQPRPWWVDDETEPLAPSLRCEEATMNRPDDELHRSERPIRWGLVNRVRQEIADGTYET